MDVREAMDRADALDGGRVEMLDEGRMGALADGRMPELEGGMSLESIVLQQTGTIL